MHLKSVVNLLATIQTAAVVLTTSEIPPPEPLSPFLSHYEAVNYDLDGLVWNHRRLTRSYMGQREMSLQFDALGR